jgi:hypothetical protein
MLKVAVLPEMVAGSTYQCGVLFDPPPGVGPYFQ